MSDMIGTAFRIAVPIMKATPHVDSGGIEHMGIISDESLDLQGDTVPQDLLEKSFPYLERHGKFNWDHHKEDIGDVHGIRRMTPDEVLAEFDMPIQKAATAISGNVYPLVDASLAFPDLKTAHHRIRAEARLSYSLDGVAVKKSTGQFSSLFVPRIAICPQPVCVNSFMRVVTKSLSGALEHIGISDEDLPDVLADLDREPEILIDCDGTAAGVQSAHMIVSKALFGALVRKTFPRRGAPPLGGLKAALQALRRGR